jgi:hypothetical protein
MKCPAAGTVSKHGIDAGAGSGAHCRAIEAVRGCNEK